MKITVFGSRLSPFVEKVLRGLRLKQLQFELHEPGNPLEMRKWNPQTGKMPVVEIDGERLYDSTFILRRLDELVPEPPLFSSDPVAAANQRQLEDWADEALYWYVMALRWTPKNGDASAKQILGSAPSFLRPLLVPFVRRQIGGLVRAQGIGRLPESVIEREFGERLDDLVRMLGDRSFFQGDRASAADLAVYGQLRAANSEVAPESRRAIQQRPRLVEYMKRVEQATGG